MRTFVIGDIHGAYKALRQVVDRSGIDKEKDTLICLGDVCDGWDQVYECIEELLTFKNLIMIRGNHDDAFVEWSLSGIHPWYWLQGAEATAKSYIEHADRDNILMHPDVGGYNTSLTYADIPIEHLTLLRNSVSHYIDDKNRMFVHGGFDRRTPVKLQDRDTFWWNRDLWFKALSAKSSGEQLKIADDFSEIFIGHTSTTNWGTTEPMNAGNIWNLDTGAGWYGVLTIMDVDTKQYHQSDEVKDLYKDQKGRNR